MNTTIAERLKSALDSIAETAGKIGIQSDTVKLLAVSKTKPNEMIEQAYAAGQRAFGENYVQEGVDKIQQLAHLKEVEWHLIGPLQSNKCKPVAENFNWVQSVDREKIAKRLNDNRPESLPALNVCIQLNINQEESKSGLALEQVEKLAEYINTLPKLTLRGIMAIPQKAQTDEELTQTFKQLQHCFLQLQSRYPTIDTLSMGMSADMAQAIENGSTMVRIGTAIFGARKT